MHEANALATYIADILNNHTSLRDNGASFLIVVTDTAGNCSEITETNGSWIAIDGFSKSKLLTRLRLK
jgi:hypothetical protein